MLKVIDEGTKDRHIPKLVLASEKEANDFVKKVESQGFDFVRFEIPDMAGLSRGKTIPISHVAGYLKSGLNLYGGTVALDSYSIPVRNSGYNEEMNYQDCVMVADQNTLMPVPWLEKTGRVICDTMWYNGRAQLAAPRMLLKKMLSVAESLGFNVMMGHEYEFYVVDAETRKPIFGGQPIFATARTHQHPAIDDLIRILQAQGIDIITYNVEHGPGQVEINYSAQIGVDAADRAFVFKNTVKEYLAKHGLLATFMTKPYKGLSGSCAHYHVSLLKKEGGGNAFLDLEDDDGMSRIFKSFIQGVLDHARGAMAIWSPTPNCYRRIRPHTYAPSNISWGIQDRSASVRVKASKDKSTHMEVRVPAAMSNPYLVAATTIGSGLLGLMHERELMPSGSGPKEDDPRYAKLPTEIEDALDAFEADTALRDLLGEEFVKVYLAMKRQETARLRDEIPAAEVNEYFELY
ncbi:glutamine synthetase family protein [Bradyrhizobium uaiense]|uniref:Glutamine synthetase n=1 Tax=Bradyrhizobium uaiense TaxID=2594946 RepID=A0A6P1BPK7_9BRAD|nr:glutamine synthetase family protein [Bradyrhizobium uaiense]NEU99590.1 glutamine synthetase [Bradyrhizobium uaiense]